jgi:4-hydroxy-3-polyprenylbenzoate decarboxylase
VIGITGASGVILGAKLVAALADYSACETHLVITEGARKTFECETALNVNDLMSQANYCHDVRDLAAPIASGSFKTDGMVIIPCSMKTLAGVVAGYSENLILRAADVCLKEKRPLVLVPREAPLSAIHLENMAKAARYGCVIMPPVLTFYNKPRTIDDMANHIIGKILRIFSIYFADFVPWRDTMHE